MMQLPSNPVRARRCAMALALSIVAAGTLAGTRVYRSYGRSDKLPIYTDRPLNSSSRTIMFFEAGPQRVHRAASRKLMLRQAALEPLVQRAARMHGVRAALLKAVIEVESGFNADARSPKGAIGLMQVMPATAARYGSYDLYSPAQNIDVGARYLRDLLSMFGGNLPLALAAYNAGENAVLRNGGRMPAYPETRRYVPQVLERYRHYLPAELP